MTEPIDVLEALLFASDTPVETTTIREVLELDSPDAARELVDALGTRLRSQGRALQVIEVGGGFRLVTRTEVAPWLVKLARSRTRQRLSRPALETLAIIAYRQPVSRPEVDAVRGVNSEGVLDNLLERRLVRIAGRKEVVGKPFLYATTREFLVHFGLKSLKDLPPLEEFEEAFGEAGVAPPGIAAGAAPAAEAVEEGGPPAGEEGADREERFLREAAAWEEMEADYAAPAPARPGEGVEVEPAGATAAAERGENAGPALEDLAGDEDEAAFAGEVEAEAEVP
jgi:segregation and condensation protein B